MSIHHPCHPPDRPSLCTSHHSILQQERLYLLRALANEERRRERLASIVNKIETVLTTTDESAEELIKRLQRSLKTTRSKLTRCERTGQALYQNLEAVVVQMQRLDDHQWRIAHDEYAQQTQHGLMTSLSQAGLPFSTPSLATAGTCMQMHQPLYTATLPAQAQVPGSYYQPAINALYHPHVLATEQQTLLSQVPATPILRPLQYSNPEAFQNMLDHGNTAIISPSDGQYYSDTMISPTDSVSTYALNPWGSGSVAVAPIASPIGPVPTSFATRFVTPPTTQVFDLVHGLGGLALSGQVIENSTSQSPQDLWASSFDPLSPQLQQWQAQGTYACDSEGASLKARRRSAKRRSA